MNNKQAQTSSLSLVNSYRMRKRAGGGLANDALGSLLWYAVPGVGGWIDTAGKLHGLLKGPASEEELREMDKKPALSYLPGVAASRLLRKYQSTGSSSRARTNTLAEFFGPALQSTIGAGIGAYIANRGSSGATLKERIGRGLTGAIYGSMAASAPTMLGALIGNIRRNRSSAEQKTHDDNKSIFANLFIPGVAGYNKAQRMRSALRDEFIRNENPSD